MPSVRTLRYSTRSRQKGNTGEEGAEREDESREEEDGDQQVEEEKDRAEGVGAGDDEADDEMAELPGDFSLQNALDALLATPENTRKSYRSRWAQLIIVFRRKNPYTPPRSFAAWA